MRLADISEAEPALCVQDSELGVRGTPLRSSQGATLDAEAARRKYTRPALHPSSLLISAPLRCSSQYSRLT
jgi:hypothetical protein